MLYSITLYLDYSKSLLRYPIDSTLSSLHVVLPLGDSTSSNRCASTLIRESRGGQGIVGPVVQFETNSRNYVCIWEIRRKNRARIFDSEQNTPGIRARNLFFITF